MVHHLADRYRNILKRIEYAQQRHKKNQGENEKVTLIAVTKGVPPEKINNAIKRGITIIAENRIQEAEKKFPVIVPVEKHLIGHLQTNKVKKAVQLFDCIQSVDSIKTAQEIEKNCRNFNKTMQIMLEINISGEPQKHGFKPEEVDDAYIAIKQLPHIKIIGVMGIASNSNAEKTRLDFRKLRQLKETLKCEHCSMGMSQDYEVAIEEGSTMVRIGRVLFN